MAACNCRTCQVGYNLVNGECIKGSGVPKPYGCEVWDSVYGICLKCSARFYFNSNKVCAQVSELCKTYDENGNCLTCYAGYYLSKGQCLIQPAVLPDPGCYVWNFTDNVCLECSKRWYFNSQGKCQQVSDLCKTNDIGGNCTSCYPGYVIANGACIIK